jgi:hypothetical protein
MDPLNQSPSGQPADQEPQEDILHASDFTNYGYDKKVKRARNWLFVVGLIVLVNLYYVYPFESDGQIFVAILISLLAGIFCALAFWTKKKPFTAILIGLILYLGLQTLVLISDPEVFFKGIIFKIFAVGGLISGMNSALESQRILKAFGEKR